AATILGLVSHNVSDSADCNPLKRLYFCQLIACPILSQGLRNRVLEPGYRLPLHIVVFNTVAVGSIRTVLANESVRIAVITIPRTVAIWSVECRFVRFGFFPISGYGI